MAVENDEIFGGHSRPKMAFKTTSQAAQVSSFVKRGSEPKSFGFLITSMIVGLRFTICRLRSVTAVTSVQNKDLGAISSRSQPSSARFVMKCACLCRVGGRDHIRHK